MTNYQSCPSILQACDRQLAQGTTTLLRLILYSGIYGISSCYCETIFHQFSPYLYPFGSSIGTLELLSKLQILLSIFLLDIITIKLLPYTALIYTPCLIIPDQTCINQTVTSRNSHYGYCGYCENVSSIDLQQTKGSSCCVLNSMAAFILRQHFPRADPN